MAKKKPTSDEEITQKLEFSPWGLEFSRVNRIVSALDFYFTNLRSLSKKELDVTVGLLGTLWATLRSYCSDNLREKGDKHLREMKGKYLRDIRKSGDVPERFYSLMEGMRDNLYLIKDNVGFGVPRSSKITASKMMRDRLLGDD